MPFLPADIGAERYTFGFTVRDSLSYFINVNSWGREEYVKSLSESFRVGDCGKPRVYSQHISVFQYVFSPVLNHYYVFVVLVCFSPRSCGLVNFFS